MKNTFRLFFTLFCILTFTSAPARAADLLVNSDNVKTAIFQNAELSQYTYNDNASVAGWKLCKFEKDKAYAFTNTTNVVITSITFEGIADDNSDSKEGQITISDGTNSVTSSKITWNGRKNSSLTSLTMDVSSLSFSQNSTFTITTTYNLGLHFTIIYAAITNNWVMDYSVAGSSDWVKLYFSQVGTSTEWRSTIFSLPDASQQFWVGPGKFLGTDNSGHSVTKKFLDNGTVNFTFIGLQSNNEATNYYPGEGAIGYVRIYSDSESDNYYAAFEPTYQMAYGLEDANWDFAPFHHVSGYEYETDIITIPSDFDTQTYKYYVGPKKANGSTIFIDAKSSNDNLNGVNNLTTPVNVKGTKGVFHIWSDSKDANWYCEFKQYWNIILKGEDESVLYEKAVYSGANTSERNITIPTDIQPEKEHYTFVGWNRTKGSNTATIKGGDTYGIYKTNDIFYPAYVANYYYVLLNDDGSEFYRSEELVSTLSEAERAKTFYADTPAKEGYTFAGWTREKGSTSVAMSAGGDYTFWTANDAFYPVWEENKVWQLQLTKDGESTPDIYDFDVSAGNNTGTYTLSLPAGTTYDLKIKYGSTLYTLSNGQTLTGSFGNYNLCACSAYLKFVTTSYTGDYQFKLNSSSTTNPTISVTYPAEPTPCFSMEVTATSGSINGQTELTDTHASISGGTVFYAKSSDKSSSFGDNGFTFGSDADSLRVTLADGALLVKNTTIKLTFTTNDTNRGIKLLAKDRTTEIASITSPIKGTTTDTVVTIKSDIETDVFYIVRATSNNTYLKSIELSGCGMLCVSPQLAWSAESVEGMLGGSTTLPTLNNPGEFEGITYASDNPNVATVDEAGNVSILAVGTTDISATYAGDETYCEQTVSYTLTVQCAVAPAIQATEDVISGCNGFVTLTASPSDGSTYSGGAFQWYHNGEAIQGAAASNYTATAIGTYTVAYISTSGCAEMSANSATITGNGTQPEVTRLTPFHYYRKGCDYTKNSDNPMRHLFKVTSTGTASDGKTWMPYARKISGSTQTDMSNVTEWISANATNDTILLNMQTFAEKTGGSLSVGDTVVISVRPVDACGNFSEAAEESIRLIVREKDTRSVAYIVSGGNGNTITYGGDFLTGYNPNDLLAMNGYSGGKTSWSTDPDPLWHVLDTCKTYVATAVNGYAPFNKYNYEPFDLVLLTDFPKTDKKVNGQTGAPYLNDLAELVDSKPFLTLKAHMAKDGMDKWKALGFKATPLVPTSTQLTLDLICSQHTIFDRVRDNITFPNTMNADGQLQLLQAGGYDSGKGLQGFMARDMVGFMNIATIPYRNGSSDTLLVACCERQTNLAARLMVLSINAQAMYQLNTIGGNTILSMLDYLLIDDYANVQDCGC
ncbi:MAG: Ig-like domain-containing protein, partial [Paludibacteraceae bacterium]